MIMIASVLSSRRRKDHSGLITDWPRLMTRPARCNCVTHPLGRVNYKKSIPDHCLHHLHHFIIYSLQTRVRRLETRVMRTLCGATCRGRDWVEATSVTTTTTSRQSTSPFTRPAPTTSWVSHPSSQSYEAVKSLCASKPMFIATYISCDIKWPCDAIGTIVHLIAVEPHLVIQSGQILQIVEASCLTAPCFSSLFN